MEVENGSIVEGSNLPFHDCWRKGIELTITVTTVTRICWSHTWHRQTLALFLNEMKSPISLWKKTLEIPSNPMVPGKITRNSLNRNRNSLNNKQSVGKQWKKLQFKIGIQVSIMKNSWFQSWNRCFDFSAQFIGVLRWVIFRFLFRPAKGVTRNLMVFWGIIPWDPLWGVPSKTSMSPCRWSFLEGFPEKIWN